MTLQYMLDTDSVSYAIRGSGRVAERIVAHSPSQLCISAITLAELRFGAESLRSQKIHRAIDAFLRDVRLMPFDERHSRPAAKRSATSTR
jgi:tRNA(fMet)-specific endonuclease VapC